MTQIAAVSMNYRQDLAGTTHEIVRARFTVRQMMILIAISAFSIPIISKLFYMISFMYNNPFSASVVRVKKLPRELRTGKSIYLGQTVPIHYEYEVSLTKSCRAGCPTKSSLKSN